MMLVKYISLITMNGFLLARHNRLSEFEIYMQNEMVRPNGRTMYDWAKNTIGASQLTKRCIRPCYWLNYEIIDI